MLQELRDILYLALCSPVAVRPVAEENERRDEINLGQSRRRSFRDKETAAFPLFLRFPRSSPHFTLERQSNRKRTDDTRNT